jgi:hypothetical protein
MDRWQGVGVPAIAVAGPAADASIWTTYGITEDQTNFPSVLEVSTNGPFSQVQIDDIFAKNPDANSLKLGIKKGGDYVKAEVVQWDPVSKKGALTFRDPSVGPNSDNSLSFVYGLPEDNTDYVGLPGGTISKSIWTEQGAFLLTYFTSAASSFTNAGSGNFTLTKTGSGWAADSGGPYGGAIRPTGNSNYYRYNTTLGSLGTYQAAETLSLSRNTNSSSQTFMNFRRSGGDSDLITNTGVSTTYGTDNTRFRYNVNTDGTGSTASTIYFNESGLYEHCVYERNITVVKGYVNGVEDVGAQATVGSGALTSIGNTASYRQLFNSDGNNAALTAFYIQMFAFYTTAKDVHYWKMRAAALTGGLYAA